MAEQTPPEQRLVLYEPEVPVTLPSPDQEARFLMRWTAWQRLKRDVKRTPPQSGIFRDFAFTLLGLAIPTALSAIAIIPQSTGLPGSVTTVYWCVATSAGVGFILCLIFDKLTRSTRTDYLKHILSEMEEIEPVSAEPEEAANSASSRVPFDSD